MRYITGLILLLLLSIEYVCAEQRCERLLSNQEFFINTTTDEERIDQISAVYQRLIQTSAKGLLEIDDLLALQKSGSSSLEGYFNLSYATTSERLTLQDGLNKIAEYAYLHVSDHDALSIKLKETLTKTLFEMGVAASDQSDAVEKRKIVSDPKPRFVIHGEVTDDGARVSEDGKVVVVARNNSFAIRSTVNPTIDILIPVSTDSESCLSKDGRTFVTKTDYALELWDTSSGKSLFKKTIKVRDGFGPFALSGNGEFLTYSQGAKYFLVDLKNHFSTRAYKPLETGVRQIAVSADGRFIATDRWGMNAETKVQIVDTNSGRRIFEHSIEESYHDASLHFSPDSKTLLIEFRRVLKTHRFDFFDFKTKKITQTLDFEKVLRKNRNSPKSFIFIPQTTEMLIIASQHLMRYDYARGKITWKSPLKFKTSGFAELIYLPKAAAIITSLKSFGKPPSYAVWDLGTGNLRSTSTLWKLANTEAFRRQSLGRKAAPSPYLATSVDNTKFNIWDLEELVSED